MTAQNITDAIRIARSTVSQISQFGVNQYCFGTYDSRRKVWLMTDPMRYSMARALRSHALVRQALLALDYDNWDAEFMANRVCGDWTYYLKTAVALDKQIDNQLETQP